MDNNILLSLDYRIRRIESLKTKADNIENNILLLREDVEKRTQNLKTIQEAAIYYKKSQDILYDKSIGFLKELINSALRFIFYDKHYEIAIDLEDKRGTKGLSFKLRDLDKDFEVSLKNGCGNGVRSVISAVLNIFALVSKGKDFLVVDEKYSYISVEYLENFFIFMSRICIEKFLRIGIITHDPRFLMYADKIYRVCGGRVDEVSDVRLQK